MCATHAWSVGNPLFLTLKLAHGSAPAPPFGLCWAAIFEHDREILHRFVFSIILVQSETEGAAGPAAGDGRTGETARNGLEIEPFAAYFAEVWMANGRFLMLVCLRMSDEAAKIIYQNFMNYYLNVIQKEDCSYAEQCDMHVWLTIGYK